MLQPQITYNREVVNFSTQENSEMNISTQKFKTVICRVRYVWDPSFSTVEQCGVALVS